MPFETTREERSADTTIAEPTTTQSTDLEFLRGATYEEGVQALAPVQREGSGRPATDSYAISGKDGYRATGVGVGNRSGDVVNKDGVRKSESQGLPSTPRPAMNKLDLDRDRVDHYAHEGEGSSAAAYTEREAGWGTASGVKGGWPGFKVDPTTGKMTISGPSAYAQAGGRLRHAAGVEGEISGAAGTMSGSAQAFSDAYVGASAQAGMSSDGTLAGTKVKAGVAAGVGYEAGVKAAGKMESQGLAVDGVTKDLTAGVNASGQALVAARAGVGADLTISAEEVGLTAKAGAFAGAEAKGEIGAHIGPVGAKVKGSAMAGAGIGAEAGIVYKDGVLTFGASAWAALGIGGKVGGEVSIDIQQSVELACRAMDKARELGIKGAHAAFNAADADGDGRLTLNDAATRVGQGLERGADGIAGGLDGLTSFLDADGSGKFSSADVGIRAGQAADAVSGAASTAWQGTKSAAGAAWGTAKSTANSAMQTAKGALDVDGDGQLTRSDLGVMASKAGEKITDGVQSAVYWSKSKAHELRQGADQAVVYAQQKMTEVAQFADRNGDGKVDSADLAVGAGQALESASGAASNAWEGTKAGAGAAWDATKSGASRAWEGTKSAGGAAWNSATSTAGDAWDATKSGAQGAAQAAHGALDVDGDGSLGVGDAKAAIDAGWQATVSAGSAVKRKAQDVGASIHRTLDADGDGSVGVGDVKAAASQGVQKAKTVYRATKTTAVATYKAAKQDVTQAYDYAKTKAGEARTVAHNALDRDGDGSLGVADVKEGAGQAWSATKRGASHAKAAAVATKDAVVQGTKAAYREASSQISRASDTLASSWNTASSTVSDSWGRFTSLW